MDTINSYLTLITFIPWIFIYCINMLKNLSDRNYQKFSLKYFKKHILDIFRIDILVLIIFFFFFASYKMDFVNKYLFPVMCLYLFVNSFYQSKIHFEKHFFKKYLGELIVLVITLVIPFIIYYLTKDLDITYKIMLIYLFLEYFISLFISYLIRAIKKLFKLKS